MGRPSHTLLARCLHPKKGCLAKTRNGLCIALDDTKFKGKDCPFYCDEEMVRQKLTKEQAKEVLAHYEKSKTGSYRY